MAFARLLAEQQILVMPGAMFETPGFFRICLTATEETCERSLPGFATALAQAAMLTVALPGWERSGHCTFKQVGG